MPALDASSVCADGDLAAATCPCPQADVGIGIVGRNAPAHGDGNAADHISVYGLPRVFSAHSRNGRRSERTRPVLRVLPDHRLATGRKRDDAARRNPCRQLSLGWSVRQSRGSWHRLGRFAERPNSQAPFGSTSCAVRSEEAGRRLPDSDLKRRPRCRLLSITKTVHAAADSCDRQSDAFPGRARSGRLPASHDLFVGLG